MSHPLNLRRSGRTGSRRLLLLGIGALALVILLLWLLLLSPVFALKDVRVEGTNAITPEQVIDAAAAPIGTPLPRVNVRQVAERVAGLPAVAEVNVRRSWPSALEVRVSERVPVFGLGDDNLLLVDRVGATFRGPAPDDLIEGKGSSADPAVLAAAAGVVEALPTDLRDQTVLVTFESRDGITIELEDEREIFFGSSDQAQHKGEVALALVRGTRANHIDVSAPGRPSTR